MDGFELDASEPPGLWLGPASPPPTAGDLRALGFEYSSRGDRVPGQLWLPPRGEGPFPLVVLQHGANGAKDADYMGTVGGPWVRGGAALACIDLPLHGERHNPKFAALLRAALGREGRAPTPAAREVLADFVHQAVHDLRRLVDLAARLPEVDAGRIAYAGLSLGAIVGGTFCAVEPRVQAVALALGGGGFSGPGVDPAAFVGRISPRPLLLVNARDDETIPRAASELLHAAAREPVEILWYDAGHLTLPGQAFKAIWSFLRLHLKLD